MSEDAAKAIRNKLGVNGEKCKVRIAAVRQKLEKKFEPGDELDFKLFGLQKMPGHSRRKMDYHFAFGSVLLYVDRRYGEFFQGGRILHYHCVNEKLGADGWGFVLWPLEKFNKYLDFSGRSQKMD